MPLVNLAVPTSIAPRPIGLQPSDPDFQGADERSGKKALPLFLPCVCVYVRCSLEYAVKLPVMRIPERTEIEQQFCPDNVV